MRLPVLSKAAAAALGLAIVLAASPPPAGAQQPAQQPAQKAAQELAQQPAQEAGTVGRVVGLVGVATLFRPPEPLPAARGLPVMVNDRVVTGQAARIEIAFVDGSRVVIGAASEVIVSEYMTAGDGARGSGVLSILGGILRAVVSPGADGGGFDVRSRAAVASVRSTEFVVEAADGDTAVFTVDGLVAVAPREAPESAVPVGPGEGVDVPAGLDTGAVLEVKRWGDARVVRVLEATADP